MTWPQEENGGPVAFTKDGKSVYVQSSLGYDTTRLLQVGASCHACLCSACPTLLTLCLLDDHCMSLGCGTAQDSCL